MFSMVRTNDSVFGVNNLLLSTRHCFPGGEDECVGKQSRGQMEKMGAQSLTYGKSRSLHTSNSNGRRHEAERGLIPAHNEAVTAH
ncbi:unnamed protein product [Pleuronectes platessa]|uniref:Uncharacterized protein n=1 Tax=Pleuronectes platessa TaxID=8262 RepID=A0A9N7VU43_PLEPL|nr:unnamed protein product [Pleuronectes platessa]